MPSHSHTRGTMNITGTVSGASIKGVVDSAPVGGSGAFKTTSTYNWFDGGAGGNGSYADFDASRSWTGATSEEGESQAFNNMQPYLSVYIWKRTA